MPCALNMVSTMCGSSVAKKLKMVSGSNNTVKRRITDMPKDILDQVIIEITQSKFKFALQLDESLDVSGYALLLVYVRYVEEIDVMEEFLLCEALNYKG